MYCTIYCFLKRALVFPLNVLLWKQGDNFLEQCNGDGGTKFRTHVCAILNKRLFCVIGKHNSTCHIYYAVIRLDKYVIAILLFQTFLTETER